MAGVAAAIMAAMILSSPRAYVFSRSSFLRSGNSATVIEMMLTPREGYRYEFEVSYLKNTYGVTGLEFAPGRSQGRQIEHERLRDCVAR